MRAPGQLPSAGSPGEMPSRGRSKPNVGNAGVKTAPAASLGGSGTMLPAHCRPCFFPEHWPRLPPGGTKTQGSPCARPRGSWKGGARPAPWASSRLCGPNWAGNTLIGPGCQLPVPSLGNELLAAPHDSSPGPSPQASRPPPCSAPVGCQEAHVTLWGQAPTDPSRSGTKLGGAG